MKLRRVRLTTDNTFSIAAWHMDSLIPLKPALDFYQTLLGKELPELDKACRSIITFLRGGEKIRQQTITILNAISNENVNWKSTFNSIPVPLFEPLSFRDFMLYEKHVINASRGLAKQFFPTRYKLLRAYELLRSKPHPRLYPKKIWYEKPIYYTGNHLNFLTDGEHVPWPSYSRFLDYELELGIVIAHPVRNVTPEQGVKAIGGFTVINDFSARDVQYPEMMSSFGPTKSKGFSSSMGLDLVTTDEILSYVDNLKTKVTVNGQTWGTGNTEGMQHSLAEMVSYASNGELLRPGELLATGTIPGCSGIEIGRWLSPGDEIELWIERVGTLKNIIDSPEL